MPDNICSLFSHHLLSIILTCLDRYLDTLSSRTGIADTALLKNSRYERFHLLLQCFIGHLHIQQSSEFPVSTLETVQELIPNEFRSDLTVRTLGARYPCCITQDY